MALKIICVSGPGYSGKSGIIREFTARHLRYKRAIGDVLGVFPMPWRDYAVGVNGSGDNPGQVRKGLEFLTGYNDLRVMIVASRSRGETKQMVERFARSENATLRFVETVKLIKPRQIEIDAETDEKVSEIMGHMP
jgi:hypothetical protein